MVSISVAIILVLPLITCQAGEVYEDYFDDDHVGGRIHTGPAADPGSAPYMVALVMGRPLRSLLCGGSIVTRTHVLTAAHCVRTAYDNRLIDSLVGRVGSNSWSAGSYYEYRFSRSITHPGYYDIRIDENSSVPVHDVSYLVTATPIVFDEFSVKPVSLHGEYVGAKRLTRVTGWGLTNNNVPWYGKPEISQDLLEVIAFTENPEICGMYWNRGRQEIFYPESMLCTQVPRPGASVCRGDSGSPLLLWEGAGKLEKARQVGVGSWGPAECGNSGPNVYVRLSEYMGWLLTSLDM